MRCRLYVWKSTIAAAHVRTPGAFGNDGFARVRDKAALDLIVSADSTALRCVRFWTMHQRRAMPIYLETKQHPETDG